MKPIHLFLCGDVMTGRAIDQIMPKPCDPEIHEPYMGSALDYVLLAERASGPIPRAVAPAYVWGDVIAELDRFRPDARIVNLETAVTRSPHWVPKGINYRMSPENAACLAAAHIDCCVLANNHVLDWGEEGLRDTLATLAAAGIGTAGAGHDRASAEALSAIGCGEGARVLVFALGAESSGIPVDWAATAHAPGVAFLPDLSSRTVGAIVKRIERVKEPGDVVVLSIHWGSNWDYTVSEPERAFAYALIDAGVVDLVHGHSSHHPKGMDVYRGKLILWGCGDLLNDYEGISGHERYRGELGLMYCAVVDPASGLLLRLELVPTRVVRFQVTRAQKRDAQWLCARLDRESRAAGVRVRIDRDCRLEIAWRDTQGV